ncbi:hypothetical protein E3Q22_03120 [Wallemia mellicola]|uniref:Fimbrin n=1 Tax=Wallemia mellicola TaxID=1708541 RepID=A0A4T0SLN3_9BASI|nr:hypothetical protein E3Q22_03120 [Wallemia mellicola]TIC53002.1 hypothetical protein E3Q05_02601 [Wallemia mellicola]
MIAIKLQRKHPEFSQEEVMRLVDTFQQLDVEGKGVAQQDIIKSLQNEATYDQVRETLKDVSVDASGRVEVEDYVDLISKLKAGQNANAGVVQKGKVTVKGTSSNVSHTINEDERSEFTRHINQVLDGDADVGNKLPLPTDNFQLFDETRDGLILSKLINDAVPDTIDERVLNKPKGRTLNAFQATENNNIVIQSAKAIGCQVVNIGSQDLVEGREILILGLIWQIIRRGLLSRIDIKNHPELYRLLEQDEALEDFLRLPPDQILLRWFNYHLKNAGWHRRVSNFTKDVSDGENYTILLNQLKPAECSRQPLQQTDLYQRAEMILQNADTIGCRKYLTPNAMVGGNGKLNLAFVAHLFNTHPGLEPLNEEEVPEIEEFDAEGEREARVFILWLNSLDVNPAVYNLFEDVSDGLVLLQAFDKIAPGSVVWRRVAKPKPEQELSRFKRVENTNYVCELCVKNGMHLVGIQGADIVDGTRTLVLGTVWQIMRLSIGVTLSSLSKNGKQITDVDMVRWANDRVAQAGKRSSMRSFKDSSLRSGHFFLDLLDALKPGYVDYSLVNDGRTDDDAFLNNKLAISVARKIGCLVFVVPEDLVEVRQKLVLTFIGAIMAATA